MTSVSEIYAPSGAHQIKDADPSEHYARWGYSIGYELDQENNPVPEGGNTAVFRIRPRGLTEPVFVTKPEDDAKFTVKVLAGKGGLIKTNNSSGIAEIIELTEGSEVVIRPGEAYVYKNTSATEDLVLHDVALPAFQDGDDVELTSSLSLMGKITVETHGGISACSPIADDSRPIHLSSAFYDLVGQNMCD